MTVRVLLLGAGGQLGNELRLSKPDAVQLHCFSRAELDIGEASSVEAIVELQPDWIINAAAYQAEITKLGFLDFTEIVICADRV